MTTYPPPFTAWLTMACLDDECGEPEHRVDLLLVRGLDLAGAGQQWHAFCPPQFDGYVVAAGTVTCETAGELDPEVRIAWPIRPCRADHAHLIGARALDHTLS